MIYYDAIEGEYGTERNNKLLTTSPHAIGFNKTVPLNIANPTIVHATAFVALWPIWEPVLIP